MADGQLCLGLRVRTVKAALVWRYPLSKWFLVRAPGFGRDRWRCEVTSDRMIRVLHRLVTMRTPNRRGWRAGAGGGGGGAPARWGVAACRLLLLEGHACILDNQGRVHDTLRLWPTPATRDLHEQWQRVQVSLLEVFSSLSLTCRASGQQVGGRPTLRRSIPGLHWCEPSRGSGSHSGNRAVGGRVLGRPSVAR